MKLPATIGFSAESKTYTTMGSEVREMVEKFSEPELTALRTELLQGVSDFREAAELMQMFLVGRGYGVSPEEARHAALRAEQDGCSIAAIQRELETIAYVN
jgi:hypothetical protein